MPYLEWFLVFLGALTAAAALLAALTDGKLAARLTVIAVLIFGLFLSILLVATVQARNKHDREHEVFQVRHANAVGIKPCGVIFYTSLAHTSPPMLPLQAQMEAQRSLPTPLQGATD